MVVIVVRLKRKCCFIKERRYYPVVLKECNRLKNREPLMIDYIKMIKKMDGEEEEEVRKKRKKRKTSKWCRCRRSY